MENETEKASTTVPFVLGLLALLLVFVFQPAAFVLGIIGIVKANKCKRLGQQDGKADAGWILSLLALIFSSLGLLFFLPFISLVPMLLFMPR